MKITKLIYLFLTIFLAGCTTVNFGTQKKFIDREVTDDVREFDLSYSYKAMGVPVTGDKSIVEGVYLHPDGTTLLLFISFPRVAILRTDDAGATFTPSFFKLSYLDRMFGYDRNEDSEDEGGKRPEKYERIFCHFAVSPSDPDKVAAGYGPYVFISSDRGRKWTANNVFYDIRNTAIRDVFITADGSVIAVSGNSVAVSNDLGKKWKRHDIRIEDIPSFKTEYLCGLYDSAGRMLWASVKFTDEPESLLSSASYGFFYGGKAPKLKSGVFCSEDLGKTWKRTSVPVPAALWGYKGHIYGAPLYPLGLYRKDLSEKFKSSELCRSARLDDKTANFKELLGILTGMEPDEYSILSPKNNRLLGLDGKDKAVTFFDETDLDNIYEGMKLIQSLEAVQWKRDAGSSRLSANFFYEYNPWKIFKTWTGMMTNDPVLWLKDGNVLYRIAPQNKFYELMIKYAVQKEMALNSKNAFMRTSADVRFFDPALDPTGGFPVTIRRTSDGGKTWQNVSTADHIRNIIDPLGNKRSGYYWYKNIDQKKIFKLRFSFGFDQGANFIVYPVDIMMLDHDIMMRLNYFSTMQNYKDLYLIPKKL